jgi:hypothetical protein
VPNIPFPDRQICSPKIEYLELHGQASNDSASQLGGRWHVSNTCYGAGLVEHCIHWDTLSNNGDGVAFVTAADSIAQIAKRDVFQMDISVPGIEAAYRELEIPGKGRCLVATEVIRAGQTLIARTPALVVNSDAVKDLKSEELDDLFASAVDNLP